MSEVTSDRSKPTTAANDLRTLIESQPDHDEQVTQLPESSQATQPEIDASEGAPADDYFEEFREWCERRRTNWPDSKDDFLSDNECLLIIDIDDSYPSNPCKTKKGLLLGPQRSLGDLQQLPQAGSQAQHLGILPQPSLRPHHF